jgi:UDP-N-acetylmuramate dehydrogenase
MSEALPCAGIWNASFAERTTFRVGGAARVLLEPSSRQEIESALAWVRERSLPLFVLGRGSNLVVSDAGWDGAVLSIGRNLSGASWDGLRASVLAGTRLTEFVLGAVERGVAGFEKLSGIPGTVGGAVTMDAGAYGQEIGERIVAVEAVSPEGEWRRFSREECAFGYRTSLFRGGGWIVTEAWLEGLPGDGAALKATVKEVQAARREKQPLEHPNAGSLFKRPPGGFAAKLIDEAGLKGFRVGDAAISEKHAGFAVNLGHATAQNVWELSCRVIEAVREKSGIVLEREVVFLGRFDG